VVNGATKVTKVIGYVYDEFVYGRFAESLFNAATHEHAAVISESELSIAEARNVLVKTFLSTGREWLYMTDTDTIFRPDVISRLLRNADQDHLVISALLYANGHPPFPIMYERIADMSLDYAVFQVIQKWEPKTLVRVDAVGAGCLLVHRDVFLEIEKKFPRRASIWFEYSSMGSVVIGEDFTFCMRAADAGFGIYVDTAVRVGHIKSRVILCSWLRATGKLHFQSLTC
jgi:GT2 family glycosyltransferase